MSSGGTITLKISGDMIDMRARAKRGRREIPEKIAERAKVEKGRRRRELRSAAAMRAKESKDPMKSPAVPAIRAMRKEKRIVSRIAAAPSRKALIIPRISPAAAPIIIPEAAPIIIPSRRPIAPPRSAPSGPPIMRPITAPAASITTAVIIPTIKAAPDPPRAETRDPHTVGRRATKIAMARGKIAIPLESRISSPKAPAAAAPTTAPIIKPATAPITAPMIPPANNPAAAPRTRPVRAPAIMLMRHATTAISEARIKPPRKTGKNAIAESRADRDKVIAVESARDINNTPEEKSRDIKTERIKERNRRIEKAGTSREKDLKNSFKPSNECFTKLNKISRGVKGALSRKSKGMHKRESRSLISEPIPLKRMNESEKGKRAIFSKFLYGENRDRDGGVRAFIKGRRYAVRKPFTILRTGMKSIALQIFVAEAEKDGREKDPEKGSGL